MSAEADLVFNWATAQFDIPASWCVPPAITGPLYGYRVTNEVWCELITSYHRDIYILGDLHLHYEFRILRPQFKRDGRGVQGNMQLWRAGHMHMNLHVPIFKSEIVIVKADPRDQGGSGSGDFTKIVSNRFSKKAVRPKKTTK